jgi:Mechanosensitive ion channel, beta-domain
MSGFELVMLVAGGALLALTLFAASHGIELMPVARSTRDTLRRAMPVASALAALLYTLFAVDVLLSPHPKVAAAAMVGVLATFVIASWSALVDIAAGVFLKAGDLCQPGDYISIDDLHGRIATLGLRVLVLETSDGDEALIPYSRISRDRLLRTPAVEGVTPHVFRLAIPDRGSPAELKSAVRRTAMLQHWSAVSRPPEIAIDGEELEVTVFSVDPDRGPDIEAAVRLALGEPGEVVAVSPPSRKRAVAEVTNGSAE